MFAYFVGCLFVLFMLFYVFCVFVVRFFFAFVCCLYTFPLLLCSFVLFVFIVFVYSCFRESRKLTSVGLSWIGSVESCRIGSGQFFYVSVLLQIGLYSLFSARHVIFRFRPSSVRSGPCSEVQTARPPFFSGESIVLRTVQPRDCPVCVCLRM